MIDIAALEPFAENTELAKLVRALELPLVHSTGDASFVLQEDQEGNMGISVEMLGGKAFFVEIRPLGKAQGKDPLMKAIGYKTSSVFDATAGWATDAVHIADHGIQVFACERNPIVFALVANALRRCNHPTISQKLCLSNDDSVERMRNVTSRPEVIYLDPMYPQKPGSASPKKPLQILKELYQLPRFHNNDSSESEIRLLQLARKTAIRRIVVKRPHYAPPIAPGSSGTVVGKLVRFDIYPPC
ncbi:MAG: class I SAM-dependent methyltransferase [Acidiferrobacterales bacterium]|nr:class I SAM-dependent methyltransferase [Acidiferrobacterales bacterium]